MRGKDYDLLDLESVQTRLAQPPDQQTTHPETGTCRVLFDFLDLALSPTGPGARVIVATYQATSRHRSRWHHTWRGGLRAVQYRLATWCVHA
jgi:hypothetical protein